MTEPILKTMNHVEVRDAFHDMVRRELVGPCAGPEEELDEKVSWRYLSGWLAPRNTPPATDDVDDGPLDTPGEEDTGEEGRADDPLFRSASMLPNSLGFTFCVAAGVRRLRVRAAWGWYRRRPSETGFKTPSGAPKTVWYRTPIERETVLEIEPGELEPWVPEPDEVPGVQVTGTVFERGDGARLVTLFLVNGQEGGPGRDIRWLFQAGLRAEAEDGTACFALRTPQVPDSALDPTDQQAAEETRMAYRNEVEFAVGHGTAVDWAPGKTPECATAGLDHADAGARGAAQPPGPDPRARNADGVPRQRAAGGALRLAHPAGRGVSGVDRAAARAPHPWGGPAGGT